MDVFLLASESVYKSESFSGVLEGNQVSSECLWEDRQPVQQSEKFTIGSGYPT